MDGVETKNLGDLDSGTEISQPAAQIKLLADWAYENLPAQSITTESDIKLQNRREQALHEFEEELQNPESNFHKFVIWVQNFLNDYSRGKMYDEDKPLLDLCRGYKFNINTEQAARRGWAGPVHSFDEFIDGGIDEQKIWYLVRALRINNGYSEYLQGDSQTEFIGFTDGNDYIDKDYTNIKDVTTEVFGKDLLKKCAISEVSLLSDTVNVQLGQEEFFLKTEDYLKLKQMSREIAPDINIADYKYRAFSDQNWNDPKSGYNFFPTPIRLLKIIDEDLDDKNKFPYLNGFDEAEKTRLYKLGTLFHDIGHHIYFYLLDSQKEIQWQALINKSGHLTNYSSRYSSGIAGDKVKYDEEFSEAIRIYITNPKFLIDNYGDIYKFLETNFPDINPLKTV